jgi:hypothetical protein
MPRNLSVRQLKFAAAVAAGKTQAAAYKGLCEEAEKQAEKRQALDAGRAGRTTDRHEEIVAELRALYRKALPEQEPLVVEAESDGAADGQAGEAAAENLPQVAGPVAEVAAGGEPVYGEDEAPGPDKATTVEVSVVAKKLNPAVQYRMESIPGYFPPRYRRVPIEPTVVR